ncbi:histidine kinase [Amycolatopsis sp. NPDC004368]
MSDDVVLLDAVPGAVLLTREGVVTAVNAEAEALLGAGLVGRPAPAGLAGAGEAETEVRLTSASGAELHVACQSRPNPGGGLVHLLRDVTEQRLHNHRVAALARTAARVSARSTISSLLHTMAEEIDAADGIAAVQIITSEPGGENIAIMGATGFAEYPDFFERLKACRDLGAPLATLATMDTGTQWIQRDRKRYMLESSFYEPMHEYVADLDWSDFVATPIIAREHPIGALLVYVRSGYEIKPALTEFLTAMAEQAAVAIDYHELIERSRTQVRVDERQRLARDLHDSVIQQVFAIGMQAKGIEALGARGGAEAVVRQAVDIQDLAKSVQGDLRAIVQGMRKSITAQGGLRRGLAALADETAERAGISVTLQVAAEADDLDTALADDLYDIVSEGVHNVVKHAHAHAVTVSVSVDGARVAAVVEDDGVGPDGDPQGYGLASMRYRASRWGGTIRLRRVGDRTRLAATLSARSEEAKS